MFIIGLIGRVGAGKSTVARSFADRGAAVIDADRIAHEVLDDPGVRGEIASRFGTDVLDAAGRVRRPALAGLVFGPAPEQAEALRDLEAIVHPRVRRRIGEAVAALRSEEADGRPRVAVLDVPLLVQAGWAEECDQLVVVECAENIRRERLAARGWNPAQIDAREAAWQRGYSPPPPLKLTAVDASGDPAYTDLQVARIWNSLPAR
jgi:dephospho-CoA kinase